MKRVLYIDDKRVLEINLEHDKDINFTAKELPEYSLEMTEVLYLSDYLESVITSEMMFDGLSSRLNIRWETEEC